MLQTFTESKMSQICQKLYRGIATFRTTKGNKNWFKQSRTVVRENGGKFTVFNRGEGNDFIRRFQKMRVREIRIPLY